MAPTIPKKIASKISEISKEVCIICRYNSVLIKEKTHILLE